MKVKVLWLGVLIVLAVINVMIGQKESVLRSGESVFLKLAPVDPRSLIQGDYMVLAYEIEDQAPTQGLAPSGRLVIRLDENRVAGFERFHGGEKLAVGERLLYYRNRGGIRLGAESFFFQEGKAKEFEEAEYALLKVNEDGRSVLAGLYDKDFRELGSVK